MADVYKCECGQFLDHRGECPDCNRRGEMWWWIEEWKARTGNGRIVSGWERVIAGLPSGMYTNRFDDEPDALSAFDRLAAEGRRVRLVRAEVVREVRDASR
ncbi:MAG TPA: hypothetical protein VEI97_09860 [bacterium]|nr:hypothetical protein [bacterium]